MLKSIIVTAVIGASSAAFAQQIPAPAADQVQDLQVQLTLTQQELSEAEKAFVSERSQTIRLGRELNEANMDGAKKDSQIKDLQGQIASSLKSQRAAVPPAPAGATATPGLDNVPAVHQ